LKAQTKPEGERVWTYDFTFVLGHSDEDGADEALLTALSLMRSRSAPLTADFGQVAFGSGDHAYVDVAAELKATGMTIVQVIGLGDRSWKWKAKVRPHLRRIDVRIQKVFDEIYPPSVDGSQENPG
jgi:hypothetical protein